MRFTTDSSPLRTSLTEPIRALLIGAMLIIPVATAYAGEDTPTNQGSEKLKRQILATLDDPELGLKPPSDSSEESWTSGFHFSKKGPIQYRRTLQIGDETISFKLYGPVVRKKPGLRFRMEGLHIGDHPVHLEGFGNVKEGGLRFTVRF